MTGQISFQNAIEKTNRLLESATKNEIDGALFERELGDLLAERDGARGFFVAYSTGDWSIPGKYSSVIIENIKRADDICFELLSKNLIMSACMEVIHERQGSPEHAAGSRRVKEKSSSLVLLLESPSFEEIMQTALVSIEKRIDNLAGREKQNLQNNLLKHIQNQSQPNLHTNKTSHSRTNTSPEEPETATISFNPCDTSNWSQFLQKWRYDIPQLENARTFLQMLIDKNIEKG